MMGRWVRFGAIRRHGRRVEETEISLGAPRQGRAHGAGRAAQKAGAAAAQLGARRRGAWYAAGTWTGREAHRQPRASVNTNEEPA